MHIVLSSLYDPRQGSDIQAGEVVLRKGETIGAAEVGILATIGVTTALVSVARIVPPSVEMRVTLSVVY